jgi:hypothetical protein
MVSSFRLEDKLNDATNFKGMHLYMLFKLYHPTKHECVCRGCTRDLVQAVILDSIHSEEQAHPSLAVEAPGSRFD